MEVLLAVLQFKLLAYTFIGTFVGIVAAAIPGFTITMAIILSFPFTYGMTPLEGLSMLMGVYIGGYSGGQISGILLGIPGTPSSICTTFDGYPMAKRGEAARALGIGIFSSFFGGLIGVLILIVFLAPMAELGLKFGPWEMCSLIVFSLTLIASLSSASFFKGLLVGALGLFFSTIGMDPLCGHMRFTFGFHELNGGLNFLPILIGLFAFPQLLDAISKSKKRKGQGKESESLITSKFKIPYRQVFKDLKKNWFNLIRSGLIGSFVGALPGAGGIISNFLSYDQAKKASKNRKNFGKGCPDGIVASEAGNNGTAGGTLIPTLGLGIPGSVPTAVMLGVLMVHSILPGPGLFKEQPILVYGLFVALIIAHFFMLIIQLKIGSRFFLQLITRSPIHILIPLVLMCCAIGSLALHNRMFDVWTFLFFGILGYLLRKAKYPLPPMIIGFILGPIAETKLRQALSIDPNIYLFLTRPISLIFVILMFASVGFSFYQIAKEKKGLKALFT